MTLTEAQREVIQARGNTLVIACPGAGKTRVLTAKTVHVLRYEPGSQVMLTTFSRDAAQEMHKRVQAALTAEGLPRTFQDRVTIGTFHALALLQLKANGQLKKILNGVETRHLISMALSEARVDLPVERAEALIYAHKVGLNGKRVSADSVRLAEVYNRLLHKRAACDFSDLLAEACQLMEAGALSPLPATHVFGDEFQDIDPLQMRWLDLHLQSGRTGCVVGDDDQSIYGFRSAMGYAGMEHFRARHRARTITLDVNFRSTAKILSSSATLIKWNAVRQTKNLRTANPDGRPPQVRWAHTSDDQALLIVAELDAICGGQDAPPRQGRDGGSGDVGAGSWLRWRFGVREGQVAILARNNSLLAPIERALIEHDIPYQRSGSSLWELQVAQVYQSVLSALDNKASIGIELALRWAGLHRDALTTLTSQCGDDLWALARPGLRLPSMGSAIDTFLAYLPTWSGFLKDRRNAEVFGVITGVKAWMRSVMTGEVHGEDHVQTKAEQRSARQAWVLDVLAGDLARRSGGLSYRLQQAQRETAQPLPRVVLTTFHGSKGLEWDNVILTDVVENIVPHIDAGCSEQAVEEERRTLFVAMTRARQNLVIFTRPNASSSFLREAGLI